jgi:glycosyltransferase involved in cell wall biosynthesis
MRIVEVIAGFGAGGAETLLKNLSIGFESSNNQVLVVIIDQLSDDISEVNKINELHENGIKVVSLGRKPSENKMRLLFEIRKILNEFKPNIVHIHSLLGAYYFFPFSFFSKIKFVQTIHSTKIDNRLIHRFFYKYVFKIKCKTIYCSEEARISLKNYVGEGIVIDNGIPTYHNRNIREQILEEYKIPKMSTILLNVGRISVEKNQIILIKLIERLNEEFVNENFQLLLCGMNYNDAYYSELLKNIDKSPFKKNIHYIGVKNDINNLMFSSDLYISSSIYEGLPITVLEAINAGVSIVLSPIKEHLNVFSNVDGCYFPDEKDIESYLDLFKKQKGIFSQNKEELISKREAIINKYHINNTVAKHLEYFKKL